MLWATMKGNDIVLKDEKGAWSKITQANVFQSNGVIHVVDAVVLPNRVYPSRTSCEKSSSRNGGIPWKRTSNMDGLLRTSGVP